ncbi:MAG: nuclear transport factor 2 family protein [Polyangiaceae bacterium]
MNKLETVQAIYAAFGSGDIPGIIEYLHPDVEWEYDMQDHGIPWLVARRGRESVVGFFQTLAAIEFKRFEPRELLENEHQVMATISVEFTMRASGREVKDFEAHLFTFDESGRVTRFRHFVDTHQHWLAANE